MRHALARARSLAWLAREACIDERIGQLRAAVTTLSGGGPCVLYFGESMNLHLAPSDVERRGVGSLLEEELGLPVIGVWGAGYGAPIYAEFMRLLSTLPQRPTLVVVSTCVRTSTAVHVTRHPRYSYPRSMARLQRIDDVSRVSRPRLPFHPTRAAYAQFETLETETRWGGKSTIGEQRRLLHGVMQALDDPDNGRRLYDYFHGEVLGPDRYELGSWAWLGQLLASFAVPVVSYRTPFPLDYGERLFPGEFRDHAESNFRILESVWVPAVGSALSHITETSSLPDGHFIDFRDGTEHLNQTGRRAVVKLVAAAARTFDLLR